MKLVDWLFYLYVMTYVLCFYVSYYDFLSKFYWHLGSELKEQDWTWIYEWLPNENSREIYLELFGFFRVKEQWKPLTHPPHLIPTPAGPCRHLLWCKAGDSSLILYVDEFIHIPKGKNPGSVSFVSSRRICSQEGAKDFTFCLRKGEIYKCVGWFCGEWFAHLQETLLQVTRHRMAQG